jgi:HEPN domain-containing protein
MVKYTYYGRAIADLSVAKRLIKEGVTPRSAELDLAAYHLQQAVEKSLKHIIPICVMEKDIRRFRTHNIPSLIAMAEQATHYRAPRKIKQIADKLTSWEANARYSSDPVTTRDELQATVAAVETFMSDIGPKHLKQ